ncbi:uncharacterized protein LOC144167189 [Haemaphysalis longicornis]
MSAGPKVRTNEEAGPSTKRAAEEPESEAAAASSQLPSLAPSPVPPPDVPAVPTAEDRPPAKKRRVENVQALVGGFLEYLKEAEADRERRHRERLDAEERQHRERNEIIRNALTAALGAGDARLSPIYPSTLTPPHPF